MSNGTHFKGPVDSKGGFTVDGKTVVASEGGVAEAALAANAVTTTKIKDGNVTAAKLATDAVETAKIKNGNVTAAKLATDAVETAKIKNGNVTLAKLSAEITPSHIVKYAGTVTWSGGTASKAVTVTGVAATDIVLASFLVTPTEAAYIAKIVPTTNTITITLSAANTSNDAQISYVVLRAAA